MLGAAATPCALFAIGASLAGRSAERWQVAGWLSFAKLVLHPAAVAMAALVLFPVERYAAGVMIAAASLPVGANVFLFTQRYEVGREEVTASIAVSTSLALVTLPLLLLGLAQLLAKG